MSKDFYDQKDQIILMVHESAYGTPEGGTAWTSPVAAYANWQRIDLMTDGVDIPPPIRKKEKKFDISSGKHPTMLINLMEEPVTITLELEAQHAIFLAYAIGKATTTKTIIVSASGNGDTTASTRKFSTSSAADFSAVKAGDVLRILGGADAGDYLIAEVDDTNDELLVLSQYPVFTGATAQNWEVVYYSHDIAEGTGYKLESFTLHVEQVNPDSDENIVYDLFGCVVNSLTLSLANDDTTARLSVEIICPHYDVGNASTKIPIVSPNIPFTWKMVNTTVKPLEENSVSILPKSVEKVELRINNNVNMKPELGSEFRKYAISGKREIEYKVTGFLDDKKLFDFWKDLWDNAANKYATATTKISGKLKLERRTNDYVEIPMYNFYIDEHTCHIHSIDEAIKAVDLTLLDATPDSSTKKWFFDGTNNVKVRDNNAKIKYHNTE